ncbi:MAG: hypothetical protein AVO39_11730 [delta proteobacterium MLS_D]|jgi:hypothetical protein|nr:MAG: hypothetical protein AVO39_11730 [delta proteobacterium MLS_D]
MKNKDKVNYQNRKHRERNVASWLINTARSRAAKKNIPFNLDEYREEIKKLVSRMKCKLTGIPLDPTAKKTFNSPSLDRINPKEGYVIHNVRIVSYAVNCALGTWGEDVLRMIAKKLLEKK